MYLSTRVCDAHVIRLKVSHYACCVTDVVAKWASVSMIGYAADRHVTTKVLLWQQEWYCCDVDGVTISTMWIKSCRIVIIDKKQKKTKWVLRVRWVLSLWRLWYTLSMCDYEICVTYRSKSYDLSDVLLECIFASPEKRETYRWRNSSHRS